MCIGCQAGDTHDPYYMAEPAPEDNQQTLAPAVSQDELLTAARAMGEAAVPRSYQCTVIDCTDIAVERHLCIRHQRRTA